MKTKNHINHAMRHLLYTGLLAAGMLASGGTQAATLAVDLRTAASGTIDGVEFIFDQTQPSGTGVLDPFLRVQNNGTEQGYNTSYNGHPNNIFDNKDPLNFTHALTFGSLTAKDGFYSFVLDIGEPGNDKKSLLSLDGLKFFAGSDLALEHSTSTDAKGNWTGAGSLLWDMDKLADNFVLLDADRNGHPGNGVSDMLLKVPESVFAGVGALDNIILWSRFGLQAGAEADPIAGSGSDSTFEEWAQVLTSQEEDFCTLHPTDPSCLDIPTPEPSMTAIMGIGLLSFAASYRFRRKSLRA